MRLAVLAPKLAADTAIEINGKKATLADLEKGEYNGAVRITNPGKDALWLDAQDLRFKEMKRRRRIYVNF